MIKFPKIYALKNMIANAGRSRDVTKALRNYGKTMVYHGFVKLHGTNAGIRRTKTEFIPQSRNNSVREGHFGFPMWVKSVEDQLPALFDAVLGPHKGIDQVIWGEWIGEGIQKGVAVSKLPKQFVAFAATVGEPGVSYILDSVDIDISLGMASLRRPAAGAMCRLAGEAGILSFAFNPLEHTGQERENVEQWLDKVTLAAEELCPFARLQGVEGVGEGYVWMPEDPLLRQHPELWFKTKGQKHRNGEKKERRPRKIAPEGVVGKILDEHLGELDLENRFHELENSDEWCGTAASTGKFLKIVGSDLKQEVADELVERGLDWKQVWGPATRRAKDFLLEKIRLVERCGLYARIGPNEKRSSDGEPEAKP